MTAALEWELLECKALESEWKPNTSSEFPAPLCRFGEAQDNEVSSTENVGR